MRLETIRCDLCGMICTNHFDEQPSPTGMQDICDACRKRQLEPIVK